MSNSLKFVLGAVIGGLFGSTLAILLAPTTGKQLRGRLTEMALELKNEVSSAAEERRLQMEQELNTLRKA